VSDQVWNDDALLAELGAALRSAGSGEHSLVAGNAAWALRELSADLELATLAFDSYIDEGAGVRAGPDEGRMLLFDLDGEPSMELEIGQDALVGQLLSAGRDLVTLTDSEGRVETVRTDDVGCFSLPLPNRPFRLQFGQPPKVAVTDWLNI